jgi:segregation and condensation protein B
MSLQAAACVVEAALRSSPGPIREDELARLLMPHGATAVHDVLSVLAAEYEGRGVQLHQSQLGWSLRTPVEASDLARELADEPLRLTRAALETLVTIAVYQPVTRSEIERIRGVQLSPGILDVLLASDLVRPGRRRDGPGRPLTWGTTEVFLDHFNLAGIADLAAFERARDAGLLTLPPARADAGEDPEIST